MKRASLKRAVLVSPPLILAALLLLWAAPSQAKVQGITGPVFDLEAKTGYVVSSDGDRFLMWLYADKNGGSKAQYPGPTLIVQQGAQVTVRFTNRLPEKSSIIFPGQGVAATGGSQGLLTQEAAPGQTVTYRFNAGQPGTFLYQSGTNADLQVEMGLVGAIVVRPALGAGYAYNHADTRFDREFLLLITEMDPLVHRQVEFGQRAQVDTSLHFATNWFVNGRNFPDNMSDDLVPWLPAQPYKFQPRMHPGERVLVRTVAAGVDLHPFHYHGNNIEVIAVDGRLLTSGPRRGPDLAWGATTRRSVPGQTADVMWTWNARDLGWDIYGHNVSDPLQDGEWEPDHGKPFPVILPTRDSMSFGAFYSGSPFLGGAGDLPPGDPGLNATAGFFYMWHSHTEKELTSNDIWPGGMVTFMIVEHPSKVTLPATPE